MVIRREHGNPANSLAMVYLCFHPILPLSLPTLPSLDIPVALTTKVKYKEEEGGKYQWKSISSSSTEGKIKKRREEKKIAIWAQYSSSSPSFCTKLEHWKRAHFQ